jgi:hypothetical protein
MLDRGGEKGDRRREKKSAIQGEKETKRRPKSNMARDGRDRAGAGFNVHSSQALARRP